MLPVITFSHAMSFHLNGEDARTFHVENADGDVVIHYKKEILFTLAILFLMVYFSILTLNNEGSVNNYIAAQQKILSISDEQTKITLSHGELSNKVQLK